MTLGTAQPVVLGRNDTVQENCKTRPWVGFGASGGPEGVDLFDDSEEET